MARLIFILVVTLWIGALGCYTQIAHRHDSSDAENGMGNFAAHGEYVVGTPIARIPTEIPPTGPFTVLISADLGPDQCYRFSRFEVAWSGDSVYVRVIGMHAPDANTLCLQRPSVLRDAKLTLDPPADYRVIQLVLPWNTGEDRVYEIVR